MQITDLATEQQLPVLLRLAFRPFFLAAGVFAMLAVLLWSLLLSGHMVWTLPVPPLFWHSHEMLFGFASAAVIGFLLTAMQNWTGLRAPHGKPLLLLISVWLVARLLLALPLGLPTMLIAIIDLSCLPLAAWLLAKPILAVRQLRNLFFVPVLVLLTVCNGFMWAGVLLQVDEFVQHGSTSAVFLISMLMAIVGGRVLPMFTANGTRTTRVESIVWLDRVSLSALWLMFFSHFLHLQSLLPPLLLSSIAAVAAISTAARVARLKIWITWQTPLLWSLHLAYWCIPLGMLGFALHYAGLGLSFSLALHILTVGGMGGMILSMMSRVSLGHTGRLLQPHALMSIAFGLMLAALVCRVVLPLVWPHWYLPALLLTACCWCAAYGCFVLCYWPILSKPRVDGHPG